MQKQFFSFILLSAALIVTGAGCQKDSAPAKTKTELITQASWKFSSASASGTDITDNSAIACIKDDVVIFSSNGTGSITEGTVVCSPTTAGSFTWTFQSSETQLMMSSGIYPAGSGLFTITALTETSLTITQDVIIPPSSTAVPVTAVYIH
ncbi:MAG: hypothetical protein HYZ15_00760 [Sphingobacteriales bacterium]|nr:hypothetical protein [Sphingobacteriales bacterium]